MEAIQPRLSDNARAGVRRTTRLGAIFELKGQKMTRTPQDQTGGDGSTNLQAGRDVHLHGLTAAETRQIALDVFLANSVELRGIAQAVAVSRAEEITNEFLTKLQSKDARSVNSLADPDMQNVLFEAQKEYSRSGEADLRQALVDLLATRAGQEERDLRTLALNEAIVSAPKLTESQRRAIAWIFFLRYTRSTEFDTPEAFFARFANVVDALGADVPDRLAEYQHLEYVGAGAVSLSSVSFGAGVRSGCEGLFCNGFLEEDLDSELLRKLQDAGMLIRCIRNMERWQINILADEELSDRIASVGLTEDLLAIEQLWKSSWMNEEEVSAEAVQQVPALEKLKKIWDSDNVGLKQVTLTSVGLTLGHAYWTRLTGADAPLSVWL